MYRENLSTVASSAFPGDDYEPRCENASDKGRLQDRSFRPMDEHNQPDPPPPPPPGT